MKAVVIAAGLTAAGALFALAAICWSADRWIQQQRRRPKGMVE